jgi:hypothetical protein
MQGASIMIEVKFESMLKQAGVEIEKFERKQRIAAANHIKSKIKEKAHAMRITGNLEQGVYARHEKDASFVGMRSPAFHNYLIEFGHFSGKEGSSDRKFVPAHPIVYPTFDEEASAAIAIMSEVVPL